MDTPANGDYAGQRQMLPLGSYAIVPDHAVLRLGGSFAFTAWIAPTSQRGAGGFEGVEGILTKWAGGARGGYAIVIDESGRLALWLTDPSGRTEKLQAAAALRPWVPAIPGMNQRPQGVATVWYFVAVSFDAASGRVVLHQDPINGFPFDESRGRTERPTTIKSVAGHDAPLLMAALWESAGRPAGFYNGKLDNPRLYRRALTTAEIASTRQGRPPGDALASWDFSLDIESDTITDTSPRKLHGRTMNLPMRAVTGHNWDAFEMDYTRARPQYGAIYFHDDDLDDAKWEVGLEFRAPATLKSGMYAARLRTDTSEDYVPFTVRPPKGRQRRSGQNRRGNHVRLRRRLWTGPPPGRRGDSWRHRVAGGFEVLDAGGSCQDPSGCAGIRTWP